MNLWIGNKNYSSWSMRAWLVCRHFDIEFTEEDNIHFSSRFPKPKYFIES